MSAATVKYMTMEQIRARLAAREDTLERRLRCAKEVAPGARSTQSIATELRFVRARLKKISAQAVGGGV